MNNETRLGQLEIRVFGHAITDMSNQARAEALMRKTSYPLPLRPELANPCIRDQRDNYIGIANFHLSPDLLLDIEAHIDAIEDSKATRDNDEINTLDRELAAEQTGQVLVETAFQTAKPANWGEW